VSRERRADLTCLDLSGWLGVSLETPLGSPFANQHSSGPVPVSVRTDTSVPREMRLEGIDGMPGGRRSPRLTRDSITVSVVRAERPTGLDGTATQRALSLHRSLAASAPCVRTLSPQSLMMPSRSQSTRARTNVEATIAVAIGSASSNAPLVGDPTGFTPNKGARPQRRRVAPLR
jgi:hypothetical protein